MGGRLAIFHALYGLTLIRTLVARDRMARIDVCPTRQPPPSADLADRTIYATGGNA
ncbi:MAG TPA: hypothetical protein VF886_14040 [Roseiarcus sp.]